jgi:hypothetical protein
VSRNFILASAAAPAAAAQAVATAPAVPDLCVVSPSSSARQTAVFAVRGRWIYTVEEPLLSARVDGERGEDVLARLAQALRVVVSYDARLPLIVCDRMNILGATAFMFDEEGLSRLAEDLDRALMLP